MFGPIRFWPERCRLRPECWKRKPRRLRLLLVTEGARKWAELRGRLANASNCWDLKDCIPARLLRARHFRRPEIRRLRKLCRMGPRSIAQLRPQFTETARDASAEKLHFPDLVLCRLPESRTR